MKLRNLVLGISLSLAILASCSGCGGGGGGGGGSEPATSLPSPIGETSTTQAATVLNVPPNVEGWSEPTVVLTPSQPWEFTSFSTSGAVYEPSVLYDTASGTYTMWYSGGWETCSTGTATSTDGIHWAKNPANPIIGQGRLGMSHACRNSVLRLNGETYVYFNDVAGSNPKTYVTHSADGITNLAAPQIILESGLIDSAVANSWTVVLPNGKIRLFYDSLAPSRTWETFSADCDTPLGPCVKNPGPYKGLQTGGAYGGGWAQLVNGKFNTYYLAGPNGIEQGHVPTYIYHACDVSLTTPHFGNQGQALFNLPPGGFDQHGDPFVIDGADVPDRVSRLWFDEVHNLQGYSRIVLATRNGPLSDIACP